MNIPEKYVFISDWFYQSDLWEDHFRTLDRKSRVDLTTKVEELIEEKLPKDYLELYSEFNGEQDVKGIGTFRGHTFLSLDMVVKELELYRDNWKPLEELNEYDRILSHPKNHIKIQYYHYKWIPVFSDHCGNFIGMDMDPAEMGNRGQIIVFGREEQINFVIANSLADFLDLNIEIIKENAELFRTESHLHDIYKQIRKVYI
ncbi:MAG: SMI1/KNR4 family protein [Bacteroidota bacterium]